MSDRGLEASDADSEEQHQDAVPAGSDAAEQPAGQETPLEADEADRAEQNRVVEVHDDDEYR